MPSATRSAPSRRATTHPPPVCTPGACCGSWTALLLGRTVPDRPPGKVAAVAADDALDASAALLDEPLDSMRARARLRRSGTHGTRITFSPKVFIPLTMLCRDRCGYCTFAKAPARLGAPYLAPDEVLAVARAGADAGCHEALFTLGECPEDRYPVARDWLEANGYRTTVDYLVAMCALVRDQTGLLPHANAGALDDADLAALRAVTA